MALDLDRTGHPKIAWILQRKPDADIYLYSAKKAGVPPDACIFVDDFSNDTGGGDELATVTGIYQKIMANLRVKSQAEMRAYTNTIPGTSVAYAMMPIPGGEFTIGSPPTEKGRRPDEVNLGAGFVF